MAETWKHTEGQRPYRVTVFEPLNGSPAGSFTPGPGPVTAVRQSHSVTGTGPGRLTTPRSKA
jgi:hypothetical protein